MGLTLMTGPASEPLSLADAKTYLRVDSDADDNLITDLIAAMRQKFERATGLALMSQQWQLVFDSWPVNKSLCRRTISIPVRPILSIVSLTIDGGSDDETAVDAGDMVLQSGVYPPRVIEADTAWPSPKAKANGITLIVEAGFGALAGDVPGDIKTILLRMIGDAYENRGGPEAADFASDKIDALLAPYREQKL